jgi:hypothetical protein
VEATGLSTNKKEYRARLAEQSDDQIDAWTAELMRDVAIRRGVIKVIKDFRKALENKGGDADAAAVEKSDDPSKA